MITDNYRIAVVETRLDHLEKDLTSTHQLLYRVIYSLLGLIGVLVGKESLQAALHNTPWIEHLQFALTVYSIAGLALFLLVRGLTRPERGSLIIVSGLLFLGTAFLRVDAGFIVNSSLSQMSYSVPFMIGGLVLLVSSVYDWLVWLVTKDTKLEEVKTGEAK